MTTEAPKDYATDYDVLDPGYIKNPFPVWDEIRRECPIAHTQRRGGSWMPTKYQDLFKIAQDWQHFSSQDVLVVPPQLQAGSPYLNEQGEYEGGEFPGVAAPPITSDPPEHTWARKMLLPPFTAKSVARFEDLTREHCRRLLDEIIARGDGKADAATEYAQQIPPFVIATMLGVPTDMTPTFTQWVREFLEFGPFNPEGAVQSRANILTFVWSQIQDRRQNPKDDLLTYLVGQKVNGNPVPDTHILGTSFLLIVAGIDTTWSSIGSALWHLAQHPADRKRIIHEPEIINSAVEELIRAYSPVTMARVVLGNVEVDGARMHPGEKVLMNFPAGNRDPEVFEHPDQVVLDRAKNPHIAFGVGIHRCAGSNLARMEMKVAIQEWLARIPDYRLAGETDQTTWAGGQVRGPRTLPVVFSA